MSNTIHWRASLWLWDEVNHIGAVFISIPASSAVDRGFKSKIIKNGIFCSSAKHAALRSKSKDWLAGNQDNVSV